MREIIEGFFATGVSLEDARRNYAALYRTMGELVAFKRRRPGEDLTSALIAAGAERIPPIPRLLRTSQTSQTSRAVRARVARRPRGVGG